MTHHEQQAQALAAALPEAVLEALGRGDEPAFRAALAALPLAEQQRVQQILVQLQQHATPEQLVAALPDDFRAAMARDDAEAAQDIFDALSAAEQDRVAHIMNLLQQAHAAAESDESAAELSIADVLENFESLLQAIATVALGNDEQRAEVEQILVTVEQRGWRLSEATGRIWAGERDATSLTSDLDEQDALLVMRTLAIIAESEDE
ncbi:MAG: hypothetical protein H0T53_00415 [Herpetosiphonaceae bacterium]|nr:hypothetical protein [Herpetosiphonaceae bacterium]